SSTTAKVWPPSTFWGSRSIGRVPDKDVGGCGARPGERASDGPSRPSTTGVDAIGTSRLRPSTPRSDDVCAATSTTSVSAATFGVCCGSSQRRSGRGISCCVVAASASVSIGRGSRISSDSGLFPTHGSRSGSGVCNHESHRRKSRMVEISLSGSGEGPGRETSRPTLQRHFCPGVYGSAPPEPPPPGLSIASLYRCLRPQVCSLLPAFLPSLSLLKYFLFYCIYVQYSY